MECRKERKIDSKLVIQKISIMIWDQRDETDIKIVSKTRWKQLIAYKELEERAGVYLFADNQADIKYIGKAGAGRMVMEGVGEDAVPEMVAEIYSAMYRNKHEGAIMVKALYTNSSENALALEQSLIAKYDPPNNGVEILRD